MEKFGEPTWERLVEAVKDDVGGNNPALAKTIANKPANEPANEPGNHICNYGR